jgi:MFS family permease
MKKWFVIIVLSVAQFVMILDGTVMNVSISTVAHDLGTTITGMQAAITVFTLTMAALMLTGGKLGDIWGRRKAFRIGSVVYGIGSLTTGLSPSLGVLFLGWSIVEGLGAVLVIPAIAALTAANYRDRERVVAFSLIGFATGLAAAVGPIVGGFVTTYFSWRYVFITEAVIMTIVLFVSNKIQDAPVENRVKLDIPSVLLSVFGMVSFVFGVLQSRYWGWIRPLKIPTIGTKMIAPFGISIVAYLIVLGIIVLKIFYNRQAKLESEQKHPLLRVSMLKIPVLMSGLSLITVQYFTIASIFFIIPVYLQTILGFNALDTGLKLIPLSIGLFIFIFFGAKGTTKYPTRRIVRTGQVGMALGALFVLASISAQLNNSPFWVGLFLIGSGFGLLASQLGNVTMSTVGKSQSSEVGGLQGTFQNLGSTLGTALVGSVFLLTLTSGFTDAINNSELNQQAKATINQKASTGVGIVSKNQAYNLVLENGGTLNTATAVSNIYADSQIQSLRIAAFFISASLFLSLALSTKLPSFIPAKDSTGS